MPSISRPMATISLNRRWARLWPRPRRPRSEALTFDEELGQVLSAATFLVFGAVMVTNGAPRIDCETVWYAVLSLTVVRMVPVALSLIGSGASALTVLFAGWFALTIVEESGLGGYAADHRRGDHGRAAQCDRTRTIGAAARGPLRGLGQDVRRPVQPARHGDESHRLNRPRVSRWFRSTGRTRRFRTTPRGRRCRRTV